MEQLADFLTKSLEEKSGLAVTCQLLWALQKVEVMPQRGSLFPW